MEYKLFKLSEKSSTILIFKPFLTLPKKATSNPKTLNFLTIY
ncbi:hypothetical protein HMPREF9184_01353 [Streptococcus sp. oral taxon 058 str. F0407]|nr:hypothetical protein HMPREF9184_01353 [Streptococcus sp. oral taxon 058 str. F0407]